MSAEWGVLRLLASLGDAGTRFAPAGAHMTVEPGPGSLDIYYAPARMSSLERRLLTHTRTHSSQLLWRAVFALPIEVIEFPEALFQVVAVDGFSLELPTPGLQLTLDQLAARTRLALRTPQVRPTTTARARQRAVALATAVAVTAGSATPAVAFAAGGAGGSLSTTTPTAAPADPAAATAPASATGSVTVAAASRAVPHPSKLTHLFSTPSKSTHTKATPAHAPASCATPTGHGAIAYAADKPALRLNCPVRPGHKSVATHSATTGTGTGPKGGTMSVGVAPKTTGTKPSTGTGNAGTAKAGTTKAGTAKSTTPTSGTLTFGTTPPKVTSTKTHGHKTHTKAAHHRATHSHVSGGAPVAPVSQPGTTPQPAPTTTTHPVTTLSPTAPGLSVPKGWTGTVNADPTLTGAVNNLSGLLSNGNRPPSFLIPIYMEAGHKYGVPWEVLAAINAIETDYGQNLNTSSAGAVGWMQFEPSTWAKYGVAVDGHSEPNPYDPRDAIFAAAKYLSAAGAQQDVAKAVYAYNHASWYVDEVMSRAHAIATHAQYQRMTVKHGTFSVDFATGIKKTPVVRYSSGTLSHFDRLIAAANMVSAADFPYVYGGGHEQPSVFAPFDCSGSVSYVMQQAGYNVPTTVSGDIPMWKFPAGPGKVTIFYNSWHTFMRIGNRYFGTSGFARPGGGAGWFDVDKLPSDYLAKFSVVHVPNLGVNSFAPGENYAPLNIPKPKRVSSTLDIPVSMQLSTLGAFPSA
ncbi:MAG TPA: lytic murein transglycosylase [Solirubrobacteraceae bacterium]|nr:lytic murein transglycosylase [Solirubrobacteraceae bacterium]